MLPEGLVRTLEDILIPWGMFAMVVMVIAMCIFMDDDLDPPKKNRSVDEESKPDVPKVSGRKKRK